MKYQKEKIENKEMRRIRKKETNILLREGRRVHIYRVKSLRLESS